MKSNQAMAKITLKKLNEGIVIGWIDDKVCSVGYDSKRSFPSDKEMENLALFIKEIREELE